MRSSGPSSDAACPRPEDLAAFCGGKLPLELRAAVGRHLWHCDRCLEAIADRAPALQRAVPGQTSDVPEAQQVLERMLRLLSDEPGPAPPALAAPSTGVGFPACLGEYQLVAKIGRGGMGEVYRAVHRRLKRPVAIKLLPAGRSADPRAVGRFEREMEAVGQLDHPNIVRATDAGNVAGIPFLVMELLEGVDLARLVHLRGHIAVPEACELIRQAAVGLHHAHEHGMVHRDIKPSNLLVSVRGEVKILDLGLALLSQGEAPALELTLSGQVMGTADYMAPEQWQASHAVDIRADVYSLGCTLYTLLAGRPPFTGPGHDSVPRKMAAHLHEPLPSVRAHQENVPADLEALLGRMTAKEPASRPATPGAVARALEPFCTGAALALLVADTQARECAGATGPHESQFTVAGGATSQGPRAPTPVQPAPPRRRRRWVGYLAALGLALVLGALALSLRPWRSGAGGPQPSGEETGVEVGGGRRLADPRGWQRLLADPPGKRLWTSRLDSRLDFDSTSEVVWVQSASPALLSLGETDATGYKLQVGFRQNRWPGGIGVYFGGHPGAKPDIFRLQLLDLRPGGSGKGRTFTLTRSLAEVVPRPGGPQLSTMGFASDELPRPLNNEEQLLEIEVKPQGLVSVRWGGDSCHNVVSTPLPSFAGKVESQGEFGVYCSDSHVVILTARFIKSQ